MRSLSPTSAPSVGLSTGLFGMRVRRRDANMDERISTALAWLRADMGCQRLSRRDVLRRAAASGLTAPIIAGLLVACGDDDAGEDDASLPAATVTSDTGAS